MTPYVTIATADHVVQPSAVPGADRAVVMAAIAGACGRIAPLWPLKHFVAVNPFLGFSGSPSPRPAPPSAAWPRPT